MKINAANTIFGIIVVAILSIGHCSLASASEILDAAQNGDLEKVKTLLAADASLINTRVDNSSRATVLMIAVHYERPDVAKFLIEKGADVNAKTAHGQTALFEASAYGELDVVKMLLGKGADVNFVVHDDAEGDDPGCTPLLLAAENGQLEVVKLLLEKGADVNAKSSYNTSGTDKSVPLADVAVIVCATRDTEFSSSSLRRMAELNVLLLICNEKFEPCAITLPYYRPTNTELLRRQIEWKSEWKTAMWRQIITAKVRNQAANLAHLKRAHTVLTEIANRCEKPNPVAIFRQSADEEKTGSSPAVPLRPSLATITASKRAAFLSDSPEASESRAARHYWKHLLPRLSEWQQTDEKNRVPGTREGVNGMLDYG